MIKNIFLDLDDTLLDFHKAEKNAIANTLSQFGVEPKEEYLSRYSELNLSQWKLLEQGKTTREKLRIHRYELLFREIGADISAENAADYYETRLSTGHFFMEGAEKLLQALYGNYRIYIASNGGVRVQRGRIASADIERYTDGIFLSQEIGADKPSPEFFERCFSRIDHFRKEETVIVGDSLTYDIKGGINAGIKTIWYNPKCQPIQPDITPAAEIHALSELESLLKIL